MFIKRYLGLIIVVILSFWTIRPLFISGFFSTHDDTQVARVFEMGRSLSDGMWPVRWVPDLGYGYGYPIFNFYAPLAYYVGGFLTILGFDALLATKIIIGLAIILSGIFMYLLAKEFFGKFGGAISALFYVYVPYHAVDIFVRGDVAELFAYAFIPLVFYGLFMAYQHQKWRFVVIGSLGYAGVILSHNLTAMMVTPFMFIVLLFYYSIVEKGKKFSIFNFQFSILLLGLLISAFYWIPALFEAQYTNVLSQIGGGADFREHFVCINQLWNSPWGFGGSAPGCLLDGMSFQIGKLHILIVFVILLLLILGRFFKRLHYNDTYNYSGNVIIPFSLIGFLVSVILMLDISKNFWEAIPFMAFLQYPWRFLLLASFFSSLSSGSIPWFINRGTAKDISVVVLLFLLLYFNVKLFSPQTIVNRNAADYTSETSLKWITSKISDEYMPQDFHKPSLPDGIVKEEISVLQGSVKINSLIHKTQEIKAILFVSEPSVVRINIAYFPFWEVFVDGQKTAFKVSSSGMQVLFPSGYHTLVAKINQTDIEKTANITSIIGVAVLLIGIIYSRKRLIW